MGAMADLELTSEILKEATQLLRDDPPEAHGHEDLLLFVAKSGEVFSLETQAFEAGMSGHISVAPKVYVITLESQALDEDIEDVRKDLEKAKADLAASKKLTRSERPDAEELEEMEENIKQYEDDLEAMMEQSVGLSFSLDLTEVQAEEEAGLIPVGAFVFAPTKDGAGNVDKPVVLRSYEELKEFMGRWALRSE